VLSITTRNVARGNVHLHGAKQLLIYIAGLTMFVWLTAMSVRGLRLAAGVVPLSGPRLKMWRIFVGALLLFSLAKSLLNPASNRYQSDNLAQAIGMYCASVFLFGLVVWLLRSAFRVGSVLRLRMTNCTRTPALTVSSNRHGRTAGLHIE
jgi:hypothetical protein